MTNFYDWWKDKEPVTGCTDYISKDTYYDEEDIKMAFQAGEKMAALECHKLSNELSIKWHLHHQTKVSDAIKEKFGLEI